MKEIFSFSVTKELQTRCLLYSEEAENEFFDRILNEQNSFTIIDTKVKTHFPQFQQEFRNAYPVSAGENCKSIDRVFELYTVLQSLDTPARFFSGGIFPVQTINVIGGGALIDLVGYSLATSFQDMKFRAIPTTPVSQLNGFYNRGFYIHFDRKINLLSVFGIPNELWIVPFFLKSFSVEEIRKAHAVCFATALGFEEAFFFLVEKSLGLLVNNQIDWQVFYEVLRENHFLRARAAQERKGFPGESFGLLIQTAAGFQLQYIDAFLHGLALETYISYKLGIITEPFFQKVENVLHQIGMLPKPSLQQQVDLQTLFSIMREQKQLKFQILKGFGVSQHTTVTSILIEQILKEYFFGK